MTEELVTNAFDRTYLYGWEWLLIPVGICAILLVWALAHLLGGEKEDAGTLAALTVPTLLLGMFFLSAVNMLFSSDLDRELLASDVAEQLQIEELDIGYGASSWHTGRGPDGQFVKFSLVKQDGSEDTYTVLMEK